MMRKMMVFLTLLLLISGCVRSSFSDCKLNCYAVYDNELVTETYISYSSFWGQNVTTWNTTKLERRCMNICKLNGG